MFRQKKLLFTWWKIGWSIEHILITFKSSNQYINTDQNKRNHDRIRNLIYYLCNMSFERFICGTVCSTAVYDYMKTAAQSYAYIYMNNLVDIIFIGTFIFSRTPYLHEFEPKLNAAEN